MVTENTGTETETPEAAIAVLNRNYPEYRFGFAERCGLPTLLWLDHARKNLECGCTMSCEPIECSISLANGVIDAFQRLSPVCVFYYNKRPRNWAATICDLHPMSKGDERLVAQTIMSMVTSLTPDGQPFRRG